MLNSRAVLSSLPRHLSVHHLIRFQAERTPDAVALSAPGRDSLTYRRLLALVEEVARALNQMGLGRNDRVALVLPNGPEMALAFLAVAAAATAVPLNPAYRAGEFAFSLVDLRPAALIVPEGVASPARAVAHRRGLRIIELRPVPQAEAGTFALSASRRATPRAEEFSQPDDIAILLHTSGTTARPKIVPLTHTNICTAAGSIGEVLELGARDRCLNVMPLFHIHGLSALLASLVAGASVVCPSGFSAPKFFEWMGDFGPTWYTAAPTVHHAILECARHKQEIILRSPLRFIRSASSAMPVSLIAEMERTLGAPFIEAYGMTEASHQIASNRLPPRDRKPGSVGQAAGPEVTIMDERGNLLAPGEPGEIVIRGANVMQGYERDPAANAIAFFRGWLRTGDQGYLDANGYLYITGRLKEIINRGGEKISPREVEEVLMQHPAVREAAIFAVPHPTLGEDVAAAVVVSEHRSAIEQELRDFTAVRLAEFKVPRRVVIVDEIPTGPTGKVRRDELAERFGLATSGHTSGPARAARPAVKSEDPLEDQLIQIWEELLDVRPIGITDDFFDLGGNSLLAALMMEKIEKACGRILQPSVLFSAATVQHLARLLRVEPDADPVRRPLIEVQRGGSRRPFFFLNGDLYGGGLYCGTLVRRLDPQQPFYTLSPYGIEDDGAPSTIAAMAGAYLDTVRSAQPAGPYLLGGFSHAGLIAFEMARRLEARGETVALLVVLDMPVLDPRLRFLRAAITGLGGLRGLGPAEQSEAFLTWRYRVLRLGELWRQGFGSLIAFGLGKIAGHVRRRETDTPTPVPAATGPADDERFRRIGRAYRRIVEQYIPGRYAGRVTLISSLEGAASQSSDPTLGWRKVAADVNVVSVPGNHLTCLTEHMDIVAERLQDCLDEAQP